MHGSAIGSNAGGRCRARRRRRSSPSSAAGCPKVPTNTASMEQAPNVDVSADLLQLRVYEAGRDASATIIAAADSIDGDRHGSRRPPARAPVEDLGRSRSCRRRRSATTRSSPASTSPPSPSSRSSTSTTGEGKDAFGRAAADRGERGASRLDATWSRRSAARSPAACSRRASPTRCGSGRRGIRSTGPYLRPRIGPRRQLGRPRRLEQFRRGDGQHDGPHAARHHPPPRRAQRDRSPSKCAGTRS